MVVDETRSYLKDESKTLFPETDRTKYRLREKEISLRPLPIGWQRKLTGLAVKAAQAWDEVQKGAEAGEITLTAIAGDLVLEVFEQMARVIVTFYLPEQDVKWVSDTLDDGEVFELVQAQFESNTQNSVFRNGLLPILKLVRGNMASAGEGLARLAQAASQKMTSNSPEKPQSSEASASPGA